MVRYKVRVINAPDGLIIRSGKGQSFGRVGKLSNGTDHVIVERSTLSDGQIWDKLEDGRGYICHKFNGGVYYTKTIKDLGNTTTADKTDAGKETEADKTGGTDLNDGKQEKVNPVSTNHELGITYNIPDETETTLMTEVEILANASATRGYPKLLYTNNSGHTVYDWATDYSAYEKNLDIIRRNLSITTSLDRNTLMTKMFQNFNRFRIDYPDYHLTNSFSKVFITRPNLNIMNDAGTTLHEQVADDPTIYYLYKQDPNIVKSLTTDYSKSHDWNVFLTETADSLEVMDEVLDTLETGETFSGYKIQYAKHNIKSITAGSMSIKYKDSRNLHILKMHQVWIYYMNQVYRGLLMPTDENVYNKVIDYACSIYYFLLAEDMETIIFWSKYYGVFPLNVPKSALSYDSGNKITFPEYSINYNYFYKEDLSPMALVEFNENSGGLDSNFKYREIYEPTLGTVGKTWVGAPFIESGTNPDGTHVFKLRYRPN